MPSLFETLQNIVNSGEALSLGAALFWAFAMILFRISGRTVHPLGLNFVKVTLASALLIATIKLAGQPVFPSYSSHDYLLLILSGVIGIGIADTLLFASLNRLGAGLSAIVICSYSPFVIILSYFFLGERMNGPQLFGVLLIISAIWTISQKKHAESLSRKALISGVILGILSSFLMAVGIMIMKPILNNSSLLWTLLMRSLAGSALIFIILLFHPHRNKIWKAAFSPQNWRAMIPASILGGYVAFIAWTGGMKFTEVSIASALNQMSTIFIFLLGIIFLKEKTTKGKIAALIMGVLGSLIVLIF